MRTVFEEFNDEYGKIMFNLNSILTFWWDAEDNCTIIDTVNGRYAVKETYNQVRERIVMVLKNI
jgi:hypothetical protein